MYGELTVMHSAAGFYLGRYYSDEDGESPGTRESDYYPSYDAVVEAVRNGLLLRWCEENLMAYTNQEIDTMPGAPYRNPSFKTDAA